jgi:hypothetical protein
MVRVLPSSSALMSGAQSAHRMRTQKLKQAKPSPHSGWPLTTRTSTGLRARPISGKRPETKAFQLLKTWSRKATSCAAV